MQSLAQLFQRALPLFDEGVVPTPSVGFISEPSLEHVVDAYLLACRTEGMSPNTVRWYKQKLRAFVWYLCENGLGRTVSSLTPDIVRLFVACLQTQGLSEFTVRGYVQVLKGFASWLVEDGYLDRHPLSRVSLPKVPRYLIKPLDDTEAVTLLDAVDRRAPGGTRDMALLLLLLDTGMRLGEAAGLP